jgi:hypothetical protein
LETKSLLKMKNYILWVCLLIPAMALAQKDESEQVNRLYRKKFNWLIQKNYDSLLWLLDERVQYIHSNGWIQTKQEVIDDLKTEKLVYSDVQVHESAVRVYPNTAIVTGKGTFSGRMPDKTPFTVQLLYTEIYVKAKGQWKLAHRQATRLAN